MMFLDDEELEALTQRTRRPAQSRVLSFMGIEHRRRPDGSMVCPACGTRGEPKSATRGSLWLEIVLWIFFIVPGVIYSIWRLTTRRPACPACGADGMIPVTSPKGRELVA